MKKIDKIEALNSKLTEIREKVENSRDVDEVKKLTEEYNNTKKELEMLEEDVHVPKTNYLETNKAMNDFAEIQFNSKNEAEAKVAWENKLKENGITFTDHDNYLPKRLELEIQTTLTNANPVFPLFNVTNIGAMLITRELTSTDEAHVHVRGTQKQRQAATLTVSGIKPKMVYKAQSIDEIDRRTIENYGELYEVIVAELAQRVIDKVVDLALVEGTATDGETGSAEKENGFIAIAKETNTDKVVHVDGKTDLVSAVEEAVDAIDAPGKKYLIVTKKQKRDILTAVRKKFPNTTFFNNKQAIADTFGVDDIIIYNGTKEISPTVLAQGAYSVDMQPLNRIEQFRLDTNENDILVETPATGRVTVFKGVAVVDLK